MIEFENAKGQTIILDAPPYVLKDFEGLGEVEADVQTQKSPFQDGSTYIDSILGEREISFEVVILDDDVQGKRQHLSSIFNPKLGMGVLRYIKKDYTREIKVAVDHVPSFPTGVDNRGYVHQKCLIDLTAPNPFWHSPAIESEPTFEGLFEFPFEGEFEMGLQRDARVIDNQGDVASPIQIEFHGPAINPRIENKTTGEFIKVNRTLGENEIMKIDTTFGDISVVFDDGTNIENVLNWIDLESTFFQLAIGENEIVYTADDDIQGARVDMFYRSYYVGV